jgi:ribosomal protein S18 acetylase RimI-like enzyme
MTNELSFVLLNHDNYKENPELVTQCLELNKELLRVDRTVYSVEGDAERKELDFSKCNSYHLALINGKAVSMLMITREGRPIVTRYVVYCCFTDAGYRNKGIFSKLYEHVMENHASPHVDICLLVRHDNEEAIKVYEKLNLNRGFLMMVGSVKDYKSSSLR